MIESIDKNTTSWFVLNICSNISHRKKQVKRGLVYPQKVTDHHFKPPILKFYMKFILTAIQNIKAVHRGFIEWWCDICLIEQYLNSIKYIYPLNYLSMMAKHLKSYLLSFLKTYNILLSLIVTIYKPFCLHLASYSGILSIISC